MIDVKPLAFLICDKVLRDIMNPNKLSFIGVFSGFTTRTLPFACPPMFLVIQYGLGQGECTHHFEIHHSGGQILFKSPDHKFFLDNRTVSHTDIAGVEGIFFSHPGLYWVRSFLGGEMKAEIPLNINYHPPDFPQATKEEKAE